MDSDSEVTKTWYWWREQTRINVTPQSGDYEFVITSRHPSPAVLIVQDDAPFGSNNRRLHDCPHMFHIVYTSNIHHLALVRPRTLHPTAQPPRPIQVRLLSPTVTRH
jgi:hypothetical protein